MKIKTYTTALGASLLSAFALSADTPASSALPAVYMDDATLVFEVNLSSINSSGFLEGLKERGYVDEDDMLAEELAELFEETDLDINSLGRFVVNVADLEIDPEWMEPQMDKIRISGGLELTTAISAEDFAQFVDNHEASSDVESHDVQGFTYFVERMEIDDEPDFAFGLYDEEALPVIFFGDEDSVKATFGRAIAGEGELTASLAAAGPVMLGDNNLSLLFTLSDDMREMIADLLQQDPMMGNMLRPLADLETLAFGMNLTDDLGITLSGQFPSDQQASTMKMGLQSMIDMAMEFAGDIPGGMPAPLQNLNIDSEGPIVKISTTVTLEDVDTMVQEIGAMFQF